MYEYDDQGRLVSSVAESEWDETEQAWMLALQEYRDSLCPLCGWPTSVCQNPEYTNLLRAKLPTRCMVTTVIDIAQTEERAAYGKEPPQARARLWGAELQDRFINSGQ